jgi:hypothetical protein
MSAVQSGSQESPSFGGAFWPSQELPREAPQARVWTYGYDADVIAFFKGHDKNSITHHGQDLMVKLERGLRNKVSISPETKTAADGILGPNNIRGSQPWWACCKTGKFEQLSLTLP